MSPIREDIIMLIRSYDELTEAQKDVDDIILQKDEYLEMFDITKAIFYDNMGECLAEYLYILNAICEVENIDLTFNQKVEYGLFILQDEMF